jgi:RNA polymerase sigma-70 factor (ECF subfamily)
MSEIQDAELLKLCRSKESQRHGFYLLMKQYQEQVYWLVRRMVIDHEDANDLVQNTFIKVYRNLDDFREDSRLFTWIYKIAVNETMTFLNNRKRHMLFSIDHYSKELAASLTDSRYFNGDEIQERFQKAILRLPDKQRLVFNMKYFQEMKYEDMSEVLHTSVGALKASFHLAVRKIEKYMVDN